MQFMLKDISGMSKAECKKIYARGCKTKQVDTHERLYENKD